MKFITFFGALVLLQQQTAVQGLVWNRISTFLTCTQDDPDCNSNDAAVAEIVSVTADGLTLVYTDSPGERIGFVDISDPANPQADGVVLLDGEPTSVTVTDDYALAGVNTSPSFTDPSGLLVVIDLETRGILAEINVGGQPDSIAVSPDGSYVAICIENERDEDLGDGRPPQLPGGFVWVIDITGPVQSWAPVLVNVTGLPDMLYPEDPEPEFVDINDDNIAVVSLQENNHLVLINLTDATIIGSFSGGTASLDMIDNTEEDVILQVESLADIPREADSITWIGTNYFATADEGDLDGGSRGFTIYDITGTVVYESGNLLEHGAVRYGTYPEGRSGDKGGEPEGILYFTASDGTAFLAVLLERAGCTMVFTLPDPTDPVGSPPVFAQILPTLLRPEGIVKVPGKDIFAVSCEEDDREIKARAGIVLYEYQDSEVPTYPALMSADRENGTPIPFSALSGLAAAVPAGLPPAEAERRRLAGHGAMLFTIEDSAYKQSRMLQIDTATFPYTISKETRLMDSNGVLDAAFPAADFNNYALVNDDMTVNMDPEGIAISYTGGFWIANEGRGTVNDTARPIEMLNFLVKVDDMGVIEQVVTLPDEVNDIQVRFGFEGVAEQGDYVVTAIQRAWLGEDNPRLGIYNTVDETWKFVFYPLDAPESQNGGWVGLSDIAPLGCGKFLVLERDNQGGPDAAVKKLYEIDLGTLADVTDGATITKTLVLDLMPTLESLNGYTYEKIEGLAVMASGEVFVNNDNDGVDDNAGEQYLFKLTDLSLDIDGDCAGTSTDPPTSAVGSSSVPTWFMITVNLLSAVVVLCVAF